jgi:hypothetical protein
MFSVLEIPIAIAVSGTSFNSDPVYIPEGVRVLGWEFTTPDYTVARTTTMSIVSAAGRTLVSGSAINEATASVKLCDETEAPAVFSGFYLNAALSGAAGGTDPYTMSVILYVETGDSGALMIPSGLVAAMSFQTQADALLSQATPVQNTWYTILDTVHYAKLFGIAIAVATTGETLEVRLTVDGNVYTGSQVAVADTAYKANPYTAPTGTYLLMTTSSIQNSNELEGRSLKVEVRKTTAAGTGTITGCVTYAQRG